MTGVKQLATVPYLPLMILLTLVWFGGSGYWYVCKMHGLCTSKASSLGPELDPVALAAEKAATRQPAKSSSKKQAPKKASAVLGSSNAKPSAVDGFDTSQIMTVLFNPDSTTFRDTAWQKQARAIADFLHDHPKQTVEITGYAAKTSSRKDETNLSVKRAAAVKNFLVAWGASPKQVYIRGEGYEDPIDDNTTEAGRARNRRAVLRFINEE